MSSDQPTREELEKELKELVESTRIAMLVTTNADGRLVSRPLSTREVDRVDVLWFFTSRDSGLAQEIRKNPQVNLAYAHGGDKRYASLSGIATLLHDAGRIEQFWNEVADPIYFPRGKTDPELILLKVEVDTADWWTGAGTAVGRAIEFVRARLAKDPSKMGQRHRLSAGSAH